jgi:hypothetical protein
MIASPMRRLIDGLSFRVRVVVTILIVATNPFRYCFGRTRRDYSPRRDGADFRETFIDFRGTIVRPAQTPWKIGIGSVGACHVSRLGSGGHRSAVVPLARGLRQVRQTREQDRRAAQLERAANRA